MWLFGLEFYLNTTYSHRVDLGDLSQKDSFYQQNLSQLRPQPAESWSFINVTGKEGGDARDGEAEFPMAEECIFPNIQSHYLFQVSLKLLDRFEP